MAGCAVAGRDNAVALWWIAQRPESMPPACIQQASPGTVITYRFSIAYIN